MTGNLRADIEALQDECGAPNNAEDDYAAGWEHALGAVLDILAAHPAEESVTEWGILQVSRPGLHRGPWSREYAEGWISEGGDDDYRLASRTVTPWIEVSS